MRFSIVILLFLLTLTCKAQSDYTIDYTIVSGVEFDTNNNATYKYKNYGTLFINSDTLSFFSWQKEKSRGKILLSNNQSHHGILRFPKTNSTYENSTILKKNYFIKHHLNRMINTNWKIFNDTLNIAGYTCTKAINDSGVVAWFTDSIPINSGPTYYHGLSGIILQVNDRVKKQIITATSITKESAAIIFPKKIAFIEVDDYHKKLENSRPRNSYTIIK